jgi:hypothetical protein
MHVFLINREVFFWHKLAEENICIESAWIIKGIEHVPQPVIYLT